MDYFNRITGWRDMLSDDIGQQPTERCWRAFERRHRSAVLCSTPHINAAIVILFPERIQCTKALKMSTGVQNRDDCGRIHRISTARQGWQLKVALHIENERHWSMKEYHKLHSKKLMPRITPHVFHHTFCTKTAIAGMDIKDLQYVM